MPCNSDYMNPTQKEANSHRVAILLEYALVQMGLPVPKEVAEAAMSSYGNTTLLDQFTKQLCDLCSVMSPKQEAEIIYDGRSRGARYLANWWDEHQEADRRREEAEQQAIEIAKLKVLALAKLTPEERAAIGF